ncbi:hypothetical protein AGLY_008235 [Aphis glycines]|uniref:Uncharacterized protein n=1 Tax=Aphis glycines TaxID=307491 RepID=A0A6G0TMI0_APHGL|nr:hypothetical protein AGLY_008235 [Aphis glycines]
MYLLCLDTTAAFNRKIALLMKSDDCRCVVVMFTRNRSLCLYTTNCQIIEKIKDLCKPVICDKGYHHATWIASSDYLKLKASICYLTNKVAVPLWCDLPILNDCSDLILNYKHYLNIVSTYLRLNNFVVMFGYFCGYNYNDFILHSLRDSENILFTTGLYTTTSIHLVMKIIDCVKEHRQNKYLPSNRHNYT